MILLDTHIVIWLICAPQRLSVAAASAINGTGKKGSLPRVSAISIYEMIYAHQRGRIQLSLSSSDLLNKMRLWFAIRPVTEEAAAIAASLPPSFHGDPMDRIIAATAVAEGCTLITADERIRSAGICKTLW